MNKNKAILFMIISVIAFAIMNAVVKELNSFSVYQIVFFRSFGTLVITIPLTIKSKTLFFGKNKKLLFLRGFLGVISLTCFFQSLNYLSIGTAVSLRYTSPIFAAIFSLFFLKEKIKPIQWFLFLIAFIGVLIIKGFGTELNSLGLLLILLSAISLGFIFIVIRMIGNSENPLVIINYFMLMAFIFGGLMSINNWKNPSLDQWLLLLSLGVFGFIGQLLMTKALQLYKTTVIAPLKYLEAVFVIIIGATWFKEIYTLWTLLGICLIFSGLLYNIYITRTKKD
ncbi:MAG: DMT family transporter [Polaribacter sp.]